MRRNLLLIGLAAISVLTASCAKEQFTNNSEFEPEQKSGQVVSLFATAQQVKTVNDGVYTYWTETDGISVFHAPAGTEGYSSNNSFVINPECTDPGKDNYGCFEGVLTEGLADVNDWYLLYPYKGTIASPAGTSANVDNSIIFGSDANVAQVQRGNDNTAHLAGANMPLYGKAQNVALGATPSVEMKQAAAVVKIVVTNANAESLTVQSVQFTANENIAGMFAMNITGDQPVYVDCTNASHVSKTAKLTVENGDALEQGSSASFYLAIKPFVAEKGTTLKLAVNGYEKNLNMPEGSDVTFAAGNIKQITFNYNPSVAEEYELVTSLDDITEGLYVIANGGYLLPNTQVTSGNGPAALSIEGIATIEGTTLKTNSENIVWKFEGTNSAMAVRSYADEDNYLYVGSSSNTAIRVSSSGNGQTWQFAVNGEGFSMKNSDRYCAKYDAGNDWRSYNAPDYSNYADGGQLKLYMRPSTDPAIKANDVTGVPAIGGEQSTTYQIRNIETDDVAATYDGTVVTSATASEGEVTFNVAPNYTLEDVTTGTITLTSASTGATVTISVSQDASVFEVSPLTEIALANTELAEGTFTIKSTFAGTISINDAINFTVDDTYAANEDGQDYIVLANGAGDPDADRMATITITREGLANVTIPVRQYKSGNMPLAAPENLTVTKHNANDGVSVTWTCDDVNVTSFDWIISTENTAAAAEGDANAVKGSVTAPTQTFTSEASHFSVNTTYYLYVKSTSNKTGFEDSEYVTENFTIDPKQDNSFDFSAQGYENQQTISTVEIDNNISVTFDKGDGSNDPKYYTSGTAIRAYSGNTITVGQKIETKTVINSLIIKKIVITFGTSDGSRSITVDDGSYSENDGSGVWTGSASSVKFSIGTDGKDNRRIKAISVEYTGGVPPVFVESVSLDQTVLNLSEGGSATLEATVLPANAKNKNVTWSSDQEGVATVDQDGKVTAVAPGTATITVTTEDGGKTATCDVTVTEAPKYAITIADGITGGTVESSHAEAAEGTEVTLTVTPDTDCELEELTVDGSKATVTGNVHKFNMPAHDVAVSASFKAIPVLSTMDEIFAAATAAGSTATDARVQFNDWVVSGVTNNNAYLTDNNGKGLIIYTSGHGFAVGDILSGTVDCKVQLYNGSAELTSLTSSSTGLTVTKGGTITPASIAIADLSGVNTGAVVSFSGLSYTGSGNVFSDGNGNIKAYNTFMILPSFSTTKKYNLTGVYIQYNATKEIAPRTSDDIQPEEVPYITATPDKTSGISADGETISVTVETNVTTGWTVESTDDTNFAIKEKTDNGFKVEVSENTDTENGREATITLKASGAEDYSFKLTQSEAGSTKSWKKVTDASTLKAGDKLLIVATVSGASTAANNGTFAADGTISSSFMGKVSVTISNNEITDKNGAQEFTLGGTNGSWTLSNGEKLLGATAAKKVAWGDSKATTTWSISISSGNATIQNGTSTYGKIMYNRDSPRFTTYTSAASASMALPMIFRYE